MYASLRPGRPSLDGMGGRNLEDPGGLVESFLSSPRYDYRLIHRLPLAWHSTETPQVSVVSTYTLIAEIFAPARQGGRRKSKAPDLKCQRDQRSPRTSKSGPGHRGGGRKRSLTATLLSFRFNQ